MKQTVEDGYSACAGTCDAGWYGGVLVYEGRQLVWGDLHIHTVYSKYAAAVDSDPNVILYATEPGIRATRHMNLYCRDRDTFERLERIILAQDCRYPDILRQVREDLPYDSVFVMRHVHGDPIPDEQIPQHFDPHFEVAMEAMQGRGNAMLGIVENSPVFPNSFLDAGCKVGLVSGTDHFREWAPNHFCLTGFWVKEVSANGVWEAIRNRYTIAMSDSRVAMTTACKGIPMGGPMTFNGVRISGLKLMQQRNIKEGVELAASILAEDRWGKGNRQKSTLPILPNYGAEAKPALPVIKNIKTKDMTPVNKTVEAIESGKAQPLKSIERHITERFESFD